MGDWKLAHVQGQCPPEHVHAFLKLTSRATANVAGEEAQEENERRRLLDETPLWLTQLASERPHGLAINFDHVELDGQILASGLLNEKSPEPSALRCELELLAQRCPGLHLVVHVSHVSRDHSEPATVDYALELLPTGLVHEVRPMLAVIKRQAGQYKYQYMLLMPQNKVSGVRPKLVPSFGYAAWYCLNNGVSMWYLVDLPTGALYDSEGKLIPAE